LGLGHRPRTGRPPPFRPPDQPPHRLSRSRPMTLPDDILALADRFIEAIQAGDLEAVKDCYHPEVAVWLNTTGAAVDRAGSLAVLAGFAARTSERRYEARRVRALPDGYVQQHVLHAVHKAGPVLILP